MPQGDFNYKHYICLTTSQPFRYASKIQNAHQHLNRSEYKKKVTAATTEEKNTTYDAQTRKKINKHAVAVQ